MTRISSGKDGLISIEVDDKDPRRAAEIANGYVDELYKLTNVLAVTEASQRRLFFERQLATARQNLARAEMSAKRFMEKGGVLQVEGQGRAMIEAASRLRRQIAVKQVQIDSMRVFAADRNAELGAAREELKALKRELANLEGAGREKSARRSVANEAEGLESINSLRDVKYYETIVELLAKQFELAKLDEAKDSPLIQVLDKAIEPDRKSKPKRAQIVFLAALAAGLFAALWSFVKEALDRVRDQPDEARRWTALRQYLLGK